MIGSPEVKVGILVIAVSALIGAMSLKVAEGPGVFSGNKPFHFDVEDAGGLVKNSAVKMAGIKVGIIEDIELVGDRARVHMSLEDHVPITKSAFVELRADGILGDKHVELVPGKVGDPDVESGKLLSKEGASSLDTVLKQVGKIANSLQEVAETLELAAKEGDKSTTLGRILSNIEVLTDDMKEMTGKNKSQINDIVSQVNRITKSLDGFVNDDTPDGFKAAWQGAVESLQNIEKTLSNTEEITDKINRGEGTLGRLVNDEETVEGLNQAITNVNEFLGGASAMETSLDYHSEFQTANSQTKSYLNFKIQPGLDRYYVLGIVDDPEGVTTSSETSVNGADPDRIVKTFDNKVKFTALFAKNFYDFSIKGGIMENAGGVGFDYFLFGRRLLLSLELIDFDDLHVRAFAKYSIVKGIYVVGGGDNLADDNYSSAFVGGGIFITNDDLKMLASKVSF